MSNQMQRELFPREIDFTVKRVENGYLVTHYMSVDTRPEIYVCAKPETIGSIIMTAMAKGRIESSVPPMSELVRPPA